MKLQYQSKFMSCWSSAAILRSLLQGLNFLSWLLTLYASSGLPVSFFKNIFLSIPVRLPPSHVFKVLLSVP